MFDSPELHAVQTWYAGDLKGDLSVVYTLTQNTVPMKDFLASIGVKWQPKATQFVGALWPRSQRASNFKSGVGYVDTFLNLIKEKKYPVTFYMSTPAQDLIVKDGRVVWRKGKVAKRQDLEPDGQGRCHSDFGRFRCQCGDAPEVRHALEQDA